MRESPLNNQKQDPITAIESNTLSKIYQHIPNFLTVLRLMSTPIVIWSILDRNLELAFWIFLACATTDWFDGYLARRWKATSKLGQILDPLADKFLLISTYLTLGLVSLIPLWLVTLVLVRDFLILAIGSGIILNRKEKIHFAPQFMGKLSTTFQMVFIALILESGVILPSFPTSSIQNILMVFFLYVVALTTILSGITYAKVVYRTLYMK